MQIFSLFYFFCVYKYHHRSSLFSSFSLLSPKFLISISNSFHICDTYFRHTYFLVNKFVKRYVALKVLRVSCILGLFLHRKYHELSRKYHQTLIKSFQKYISRQYFRLTKHTSWYEALFCLYHVTTLNIHHTKILLITFDLHFR